TSSNTLNVEAAVLIFQAFINDLIEDLTNNLKYIFDVQEYGTFSLFEKSKLEHLTKILSELNIEFNGREFKRLGNVEFNKEEIRNISGSLKLNQNPELNIEGKKEAKNTFAETNVQY